MFRLLKAACFLGFCLSLSTISCLAFTIDVPIVVPDTGLIQIDPVDLNARSEPDLLPTGYLSDLVDIGMPVTTQSSVKMQGFSFASPDELGVSQYQEGLHTVPSTIRCYSIMYGCIQNMQVLM